MSAQRAVSGDESGRLGIVHWEVVVNSRTPTGTCVSFVKASKLNFFFFKNRTNKTSGAKCGLLVPSLNALHCLYPQAIFTSKIIESCS